MREDHPSSVESQIKNGTTLNKSTMNIRPIGLYILIKTIEEEIETSSGLLLSAEEANEMRYKKGRVIVPGSDVTVISKDDLIYYDKRAGYTMLIGSESYTVITQGDVVVAL